VIRVPVHGGFHSGSLPPVAPSRRFCPCRSRHARPRGVRPSPALAHGDPSPVLRRSRRDSRRRFFPARGCSVSSLGFLPGPGFWLPRPPARSAPGMLISSWTSAKRLAAAHDDGFTATHPLSGLGKVRARPRGPRVARRPVRPPRLPPSPTSLAFSRLGHASQDCWHLARWVGSRRPGPCRPSAHCPRRSPKGRAGGQRMFPRGFIRVRARHQRRFPLCRRPLIRDCPPGWNPAGGRPVVLSPRGVCTVWRSPAPSLASRSLQVRFPSVPALMRSACQVAFTDGYRGPRRPGSLSPSPAPRNPLSRCPALPRSPAACRDKAVAIGLSSVDFARHPRRARVQLCWIVLETGYFVRTCSPGPPLFPRARALMLALSAEALGLERAAVGAVA